MRSIELVLLSLLLVLLGCAQNGSGITSDSDAGEQGAGQSVRSVISGTVHGGQQPVIGSHIYLFAANSLAYGGSGIPPVSLNASVSLLNNVPGKTTLDSSGGPTNGDYFVTTDASGAFSLTGDYQCTTGSQLYLYALGGNPGAGNNAAIGELAALGSCTSPSSLAATFPFVTINEATTVAAAYTFAGFATDATHVSSGLSALAQTGIANAFANAANLVNVATGTVRSTIPSGNAIVPQTTINTLANILSACVNSTSAVTTCANLFGNISTSSILASRATETATAAIYIAQNPGVNVASLFNYVTASAPFQPVLNAAPNDFTIGLHFTGAVIENPLGIAISTALAMPGSLTLLATLSRNLPTLAPSSQYGLEEVWRSRAGLHWTALEMHGSPTPPATVLRSSRLSVRRSRVRLATKAAA